MKDVQCKKCRYLLKDKDGYNWCPNKTFVDDPDIDLIRNCEWYAAKTNADHIRSMTNDELARFLQGVTLGIKSPLTDWFDWLKQEYAP